MDSEKKSTKHIPKNQGCPRESLVLGLDQGCYRSFSQSFIRSNTTLGERNPTSEYFDRT